MAGTRELLAALTAHYRKPGETRDGEILLTEVTAPRSSRRCDLLRISTWASRGSGIDVHELKTSRSDWLRELDDPAKAEAWWPYCSRFWVVAPVGIVKPDELPPGWGLMEPPTAARRRRFKAVVPAATKEPQLDVGLMTELISRADNVRLTQIEQLHYRHREEVSKAIREARADAEVRKLSPTMRRRLDFLEKLESELGADLSEYSYGDGKTLNSVEPGELAASMADFVRGHVTLQQRQEGVDRRIDGARRAAQSLLDATKES